MMFFYKSPVIVMHLDNFFIDNQKLVIFQSIGLYVNN